MKSPPTKQLLDRLQQQLGLEQPLKVDRALTGGTLNRPFLLRTGNRQLVLKQASPVQACGSNWQAECQLHRKAALAGLAPDLLLQDETARLLVMEHAGDPVQPPVADSLLVKAGELLGQLHHSTYQPPRRSYRDLLAALIDESLQRAIQLPREKIEALQPVLLEWDKKDGCWCHHDLSAGNLLNHQGKLQLIDWEYSGLGNPAFDLASLAKSWQLTRGQRLKLLESHALGITGEELEQARAVVDLFDQLWFALYLPVQGNPH